MDANHEIQSDPVTNDELFLDFFNFDFNFEDQNKKKRKEIINETSQNNSEYIPKHDYDGVHRVMINLLNTLDFFMTKALLLYSGFIRLYQSQHYFAQKKDPPN